MRETDQRTYFMPSRPRSPGPLVPDLDMMIGSVKILGTRSAEIAVRLKRVVTYNPDWLSPPWISQRRYSPLVT